jgi:hypothetical protein
MSCGREIATFQGNVLPPLQLNAKMEAIYSSSTLTPTHETIRHHYGEDQNFKSRSAYTNS